MNIDIEDEYIIEESETEDDFYADKVIEEKVEDDEISSGEGGFMRGYNSAR